MAGAGPFGCQCLSKDKKVSGPFFALTRTAPSAYLRPHGRPQRLDLGGYAYHVLNRGNDRAFAWNERLTRCCVRSLFCSACRSKASWLTSEC
jgi:hypothetical protein